MATVREEEQLYGLEGGPAVRMRADELAPFGWAPLWVLVAINLVDRIDASIVTGILPHIQQQWGFSDTQGGAIPTAAAIAGMIVSLPAGYLADRRQRTKLLAIVVASWALLTMVSALAVGFLMFFLIRILLGAADNIDNPSASSLIADYFPPRARAKAFGYQRMAFYLGIPIGGFLGGFFGEVFNWRAAFLLMVIPGLAVAGLCVILREPVRGAIDRFVANLGAGEVSKAEAAEAAESWVEDAEAGETGAAEGRGIAGIMRQLQAIVRVRTIFYVYFGLAVLFFGLGGIGFWLTTFLVRYRDIGTSAASGLTALSQLVGILGGVFIGAQIGDRWHRQRPGGRILISGLGLLSGSIALVIALTLPNLWLQFFGLTVSLLLLYLAVPNLTAGVADVLTANQRGIGFGLFSLITTAGAALGPLAVGFVSDLTELRTAFYILAVPAVIGALMVLRARTSYDSDAERVLEEARLSVGG